MNSEQSFIKVIAGSTRWQRPLVYCLLFTAYCLLVAGCGGEAPTPTPTAGVPTMLATAAEIPSATPTLVPTNTPIPTNTPPPTPTATSVVNFAPSLTPLPTWTPAPTQVALMEPGSVVAGVIQPGVAHIHYFEATRFDTVFFLARGSDEVDLALALYEVDVLGAAGASGQTLGEALGSFAPDRLEEDSGIGQPEFMVYTPQSDTIATLGVGGITDAVGRYKLYMFDTITTTEHAPLVQTDTVPAGGVNQYTLASRGARPVAAFVDPIGNVDVSLVMRAPDGRVIVTSDFGRGGSPEAAFIRPGTSAEYTVEVSAKTAASYEIVLVAIADDVEE